jgi:uncharacterized membrane protein
MEKTIQFFIYGHAFLGFIALCSGCISLSVKKGGSIHRKSGKVFFYSMLCSIIAAVLIATLPGHESPLLFSIGIFSMYFLLGGYRALRFKKAGVPLFTDRIICWIMLISGLLMISYEPLIRQDVNIIMLVFGTAGIIFSIRDLRLYNKPEMLRKSWLQLHLSKMIAAYSAAITAFIVVNNFIPGIYGWFAPGIIGGFIIRYWIRKYKKKVPDQLAKQIS